MLWRIVLCDTPSTYLTLPWHPQWNHWVSSYHHSDSLKWCQIIVLCSVVSRWCQSLFRKVMSSSTVMSSSAAHSSSHCRLFSSHAWTKRGSLHISSISWSKVRESFIRKCWCNARVGSWWCDLLLACYHIHGRRLGTSQPWSVQYLCSTLEWSWR